MTRLLDPNQLIPNQLQHQIFDDFQWLISPHLWTAGGTGNTSAILTTGGAGGVYQLQTDNTSGHEAYIGSTNSPFLFANNKPLVFEAKINFSEANTNTLNLLLGIKSATVGTAAMQAATAGPAASFSGIVLYKVSGETVWHLRTSIGSTNTDTKSNVTSGTGVDEVMKLEFKPFSSTQADVIPYRNGVQLVDANGKPIKQAFTYTSAVVAGMGAYINTNSATVEACNIDYLYAGQLR